MKKLIFVILAIVATINSEGQTNFVNVCQDCSYNWQNFDFNYYDTTSVIDWSQSVSDIDRQLYAKYGLSEVEVVFFEGMIKAMG
jgi:hypothetical protein